MQRSKPDTTRSPLLCIWEPYSLREYKNNQQWGGGCGQEGRLLGESSVRTTVSKDTFLGLSLPISKEGQELIQSVGVGECFILGISA